MAPPKVSATAVNAFNDDMSVIDPLTFTRVSKKHNRGVNAAIRNDSSKRHKSILLWKPLENKAADAAGGKEKIFSSSMKEKAVELARGKTRFYRESIWLNQDMVEGRLLGFGRLFLAWVFLSLTILGLKQKE